MKKLLFFAAALLCLVACNNNDNAPAIPQGQMVFHVSVDNGSPSSAARKVAPDNPEITEGTMTFHWEADDKVVIWNGSDYRLLTIVPSSISGANADFTGDSLPDMSSYSAIYVGKNTTVEKAQAYLNDDTYELELSQNLYGLIFVGEESGSGNSFTLDPIDYCISVPLTGNTNVRKMKYSTKNEGEGYTLASTIVCDEDGLQLSDTPQKVIISVKKASKHGFQLELLDKYDYVLETKESPADITEGGVVTFPEVGVKGYIKLFLEDGTTEAATNEVMDYLSHCDEGTTLQLVAKFFPENIPATNVTWSSDNEDILTVSSTGLLTKMCGDISKMVSYVTCNITCASNDGSRTKASFLAATCLAAGTRITMADGSFKLVENIVEGDLIRTFDHEAGCISTAKVCLAWKGESKAAPMNLTFASGKKLAIVGTHDLLLENTRKYVRINRGNVEQYVGKRFYNAEAGKWDALVSYEMGTPVDYYCIYSAKHLNCIAEGLLTCPDDVDHNLNIYELDANLKADAAQLQADIAQYGLCDVAKDFPEFAQYKEQMEALGGQYVYIAIGKGLVPANYIEQMKSYWLAQ